MEEFHRAVHDALTGQADAEVRERFIVGLQGEFGALEAAIAEAYERWSRLDREFARDHDSATVVGMAFLVVARLTMSTNLLSLGHLALSGAAFRQSLEALAAAFLFADPASPHRTPFWEGKFSVNKAIRILLRQAASEPRLNRPGVEALTKAREFYDRFSHPTALSMGDLVGFDGQGGYSLGACFDEEKVPFYAGELTSRTNFAKTLPNAVEAIEGRLREWSQFKRGA